MKKNFTFLLVLLSLCAYSVTAKAQQVYYVSATNGDDNNTGDAPGQAFKTIYKAMAVTNANPDIPEITICVEAGVYRPTDGTGDPDNRTITFTFFRNLYGLSTAGKTLKILGGYNFATGERDIANNPTWLDGDIGVQNNNSDNSYHVVVVTGAKADSDSLIISGFGIRNGYGNSNSFVDITPELSLRSDNGGGMAIVNNFNDNRLLIENCVFNNNFGLTGGGIYNNTSQPVFSNCVVADNQGQTGAGLFSIDGGNLQLLNCVFNANNGLHDIALSVQGINSNLAVTNCTFTQNISDYAYLGDMIITILQGVAYMTNCIFQNNNAGIEATGATFTVAYSNIQGGYTGTGNIDADPLFVNIDNAIGPDNIWRTADDGLVLQSCSPSQETGDNTAIPAYIISDIKGDARISAATVDMGAYETAGFTVYADTDGDGFGDNNNSIVYACSIPDGYVTNKTDCDDSKATVHPGAAEICGNGIDDNCNGQIDEGCILHTFYADTDADGFGNAASSATNYTGITPAGYVADNTDCDDTKATVNPGATEICGNGIDDNCNGQVDEGCGPIKVSIGDASITEGEAGVPQVLLFVVSLDAPATVQSSVNYKTVSKTAIAYLDYVPVSGTLTFEPGEQVQFIAVEIIGDTWPEFKEVFNVKLRKPVNIQLDDKSAKGNIYDDDKWFTAKTDSTATASSVQLKQSAKTGTGLVVPNVIHRSQTWRIPGLPANNKVMVYDANGRVVFSTNNYSNNSNFSKLAMGMYYYNIIIINNEGNQEVYKGKLMITN